MNSQEKEFYYSPTNPSTLISPTPTDKRINKGSSPSPIKYNTSPRPNPSPSHNSYSSPRPSPYNPRASPYGASPRGSSPFVQKPSPVIGNKYIPSPRNSSPIYNPSPLYNASPKTSSPQLPSPLQYQSTFKNNLNFIKTTSNENDASFDDGGLLDVGNGVVLDPHKIHHLQQCIGETLITTDGTTLLGGDDKAGIAEIMTSLDIILNVDKIPHGRLEIVFSADEETGRSPNFFPVEKLEAKIGYTIDGESEGEVNIETFNGSIK